MSPENTPMDPALERAISEIRGESIPGAVVDAAAERVWQRLTGHIPGCSGFQALFADYRAGRLPEERALLVQDHLRECIACRRVYGGAVLRPALHSDQPKLAGRPLHAARWAIAAGVVAAGGLAAWLAATQYGSPSGRAIVRSIHGTLYEVSSAGLRAMAPGEALPDGVEIRTARDSRATVALRDGSVAEMRERSDLATSTAGGEITFHLGHGSIILQAAHRRSGHLYVATADCRVAVTGTLFSVSAGVKGSRVSVVEGEVKVSRQNRETVLHPGDQWSTSEILQPLPVREDLGWSHNARLPAALAALRESLSQAHLPRVRYQSRLLPLLPASTVFYVAIPNLSGYFAEAERLFRQKSARSAELRAWLEGPGAEIDPLLEKLRAANEYLGDEIVVFGTAAAPAPVIVAEVKGDAQQNRLAELLEGAGLPLSMETRGGLVLLSPDRRALAVTLDSTFPKTAFYQRILRAYDRGAGLLVSVDLSHFEPPPVPRLLPDGPANLGVHYLVAEQNSVAEAMETRATFAFDAARQGMAAWLASPAPIGAIDYITPEATLAAAFSVTDPAAVLDQAAEAIPGPGRDRGGLQAGSQLRRELAASLGGEFAIALDGPPLPVPSWKLVAEVSDPVRFETALEKWIAAYNQAAAAAGGIQLRTAREIVDGRTWYLLGWGQPNPLSEARYTFSSGYLIAAPTRALVMQALETSANEAGLARSPAFTALLPPDSYTDFSAVVYQNLGTSLAPFAGLLGPEAANLTQLKPLLVAAYGEPDRITFASTGDLLGFSFHNFLTGSILGIARNMLPVAGLMGTSRSENSSR
jgi:FecR protein